MLKERGDQYRLCAIALLDGGMAAVAWVVAYFWRMHGPWMPPPTDVPPVGWCLEMLPLVVITSLFSFHLAGLYQMRQRWHWTQEFLQFGRAALVAVLVLVVGMFFFRTAYESRLALMLYAGLLFVGLLVHRRLWALYFRWRRRQGGYGHRALIVGTGRLAHEVDRALRANNWVGVQPMGFIDDPEHAPPKAQPVGRIEDLPRLIDEHQIDYVFVALSLDRFGETRRVYEVLNNTLVDIRLVPDIPQADSLGLEVSQIEGVPVISLQLARYGLAERVAKRAMDLAGALFGLVVLSPVLLVLAALVKFTDGGPIFYAQERMGLNGKRFKMYKFRSMRVDAERDSGPVWAKDGDNRRTWLGTFLRKSSLDELPQLWNVLRGDMSLVGPRPERPFFIEQFRESIPRYMLRHAMKAGITGWAQINGWRGNTSLRKRVQYDIYYITHWSLWLDLRILVQTFLVVLRDRNAY